jgi:uncharacterized membrane protein YkoI
MAAAPALADEDDDDHDQAREAVEHGAIAPLAEVLARPELKRMGELVHVRLDREDGRWIYRLRFVGADGRVREAKVDATLGPDQGRR